MIPDDKDTVRLDDGPSHSDVVANLEAKLPESQAALAEAKDALGILVREHYGPQCFCTEHWVRGHTGDCGEWHDARSKAIKIIGHYGKYTLRSDHE